MGQLQKANAETDFEFSGGALCLDYANTVGDRPRCRNEKMTGYADLLSWARQAGIVDGDQARILERRAGRSRDRTRRAFHRAIELREAIYRAFSALAAGDTPDPEQLAPLNAALLETLPRLRLACAEDGCDWTWAGLESSLDGPLWPVIRSAADLITSSESRDVRECDSETCSWLFVDRSRTRRRRWCDMKTCGNRAKARRHYERNRKRSRSD